MHLLVITVLLRLLGARIRQGLHWLDALALCVASVAVSRVSCRLVEKPFIRVRASSTWPLPVLDPTL